MTRVLIVDDDEKIRRVLGRVLTKENYEYDDAANVKEAQDLLEERYYNVVFSDINMPGGSGVNLVKYIMEKHPETSIIMATVLNDPAVAQEFISLGIHGYIIKHFDSNQVSLQLSPRNMVVKFRLKLR